MRKWGLIVQRSHLISPSLTLHLRSNTSHSKSTTRLPLQLKNWERALNALLSWWWKVRFLSKQSTQSQPWKKALTAWITLEVRTAPRSTAETPQATSLPSVVWWTKTQIITLPVHSKAVQWEPHSSTTRRWVWVQWSLKSRMILLFQMRMIRRYLSTSNSSRSTSCTQLPREGLLRGVLRHVKLSNWRELYQEMSTWRL